MATGLRVADDFAPLDPSILPKFNPAWAGTSTPASKPGPIMGGLAAGVHQLGGLAGSGLQGIGALVGSQGLQEAGQNLANDQNATAARVGRPDLDIAPWQQGGASVAPWLEYQAAKMLPTLAGYGLASAVAPETAAGAAIAKVLPSFMGGVAADATPAAVKSAAKFVLGGGAFGGATGFGQAIQSASEKPGGVTSSDAWKALAETPAYAAAGAFGEPGFLRNALKGAEGNFATRVITGGLKLGAVGGIQAGTLAALDQTMRPDLPWQDKMNNIVNATVTGLAVGTVFGGAVGTRALKRADPTELLNNPKAINDAVDQALDLGGPEAPMHLGGEAAPVHAQPAPFTPQSFVDAYLRGEGRGDTVRDREMQQYHTNNAADVEAEFQSRANPMDLGGPEAMQLPRTALPPPEPEQLPGPANIADRSAIPGSTMVVGHRDDGGRFTNEATGVEQPPVVPEDTSRAYRNFTDPELFAAANALANKGEAAGGLTPEMQDIAKSLADELRIRRNESLTQTDISKPAAEAVSASANQRGAGETQAAPASVNDIKSYIADVTDGLKLPSGLKADLAKAKSVEDVQDIVHQESIIDAKGGKNRDLLAQRVGMLDGDSRPTPLADEVSARKTPDGEQPEQPAFMAEVKDAVKGSPDPAIKALANLHNKDEVQLAIYRELGERPDGSRDTSDNSGLEKVAQDYGVLNDQKQLTPLALQLAQRDPIDATLAKQTAKAQGYKGKDATAFNQGVQDYVSGKDISAKGDAYQSGVEFAQETNSVPKGSLKQYRGREVTDQDVANVQGTAPAPQPREVPADVRQGQLINESIDNAGLHPTKDESEIAALKGMVRDGDYQGAIDGLKSVQRGEGLVGVDLRPEREFQPARIDQTSRDLSGLREQARSVLARGEGQQAATKAEAERAIRTYELGKMVDAAHSEGEISGPDRLRLVNHLRNGRFDEVAKVVGEPAGRIGGKIAQAASRAQRRAELHAALQDVLAQHARENEVPELNVDKNGVLSPKIGGRERSDEEFANAGKVISYAVDHPDDAKGALQEVANQGGELGAIAARLVRFVPDGQKVQVLMPQDMNHLEHTLFPDTQPTGEMWGLSNNVNKTTYLHVGMPSPAVLVHEMTHAIVDNHIALGTPIGREIESIFNRFKNNLQNLKDYAGVNAHEFAAEFMAHQAVRDYIRILGDGKGSIFQRMWDAVRKAIGMPPRDYVERMFQLVEQAGHNPVDTSGRAIYSPMMAATIASPELNDRAKATIGDMIKAKDDFIAKVDPASKERSGLLYLGGDNIIERRYGKSFELPEGGGNGLRERNRAIDGTGPLRNRFAAPTNLVYKGLRGLEGLDRKSLSDLNKLVILTANGTHAGRTWEQQSDVVKANPANKPAHAEAQQILRSLQTKDAKDKSTMRVDTYNNWHAHEDSQMMRQFADQLHRMVTTNVISADQVPGFEEHPADTLMDRSTRETFDVQQTKQFWQDYLTTHLQALDKFVEAQQQVADHPGTEKADRDRIVSNVDDLNKLSQEVKTGLAKLAAGPNFHLGRTGDYFVDMKLRTDEEGNVDKAALKAAAQHLKDFGVVVPLNATADHIFMRVDNLSAQNNLVSKVKELQKAGIVTSDPTAGKRGDDGISRAADPWLPKYEANIKARTDLSSETKDQLIHDMRATALDRLSDNSIAKFLAPRDYVPGFQEDMVGSFLKRAKASNDAMAGRVTAPKISAAYAKMETSLQNAQRAPRSEVSLEQRAAMKDVLSEMRLRDSNRSNYNQSSALVDGMRRIANFWGLGGTVAYPVVLFSQLVQVALPRLGSEFGFVRTAKAMAAVTPEALRIMKAVFKVATDAPGLNLIQKGSRAANVEINLEALRKADVTPARAEYLLHIENAGQLGVGSQAHTLTSAANDSIDGAFNHTMQYAAGLAYYTETLTRVITALARANLSGDTSRAAAESAIPTLKNSLFDYRLNVQGRAFGRQGMFGDKTPLMTQFMTYQSQLVQQLYQELHDAFTKGVDPQRKSEARQFLLQHAAVTTALAGTMGLPFASAFAAAYNTIKEKLDPSDGPSDVLTSYRNFLSDTFGKGMGEVIARGGLRPLGVEMSQRIGEQNDLPFTRFLSDRRSFKDQMKDLESRSWGAPANMAANFIEGGERISNGDVMGGLTAMMPAALSNPLKAYRMTQEGYTDSVGNKLPIATPGTDAVMAQLLGFMPEAKGEYEEAKSAQVQRSQILQRQSTQMRSAIADAITQGNSDQAHSLITQAQDFDRANPGYAVLPGVEGAIMRRQQGQALAQRFQTPIGLNPRDIGAPPFTRFANVDYRAQ